MAAGSTSVLRASMRVFPVQAAIVLDSCVLRSPIRAATFLKMRLFSEKGRVSQLLWARRAAFTAWIASSVLCRRMVAIGCPLAGLNRVLGELSLLIALLLV